MSVSTSNAAIVSNSDMKISATILRSLKCQTLKE